LPWITSPVDCDERLEALLAGVKMRGRMIVEIHPDHDAEKDGDDGHGAAG
jgi:hypothetical protein